MANRVPPFPLHEVLSDPACALLTPPAIGHLILLLDACWAANAMAVPAPQTAIQAAAKCSDTAWRRYGPDRVRAFQALAPDLARALAKSRRIIASRQANAARARAAKPHKRLTQTPVADRYGHFAPQPTPPLIPIPRKLPQPPRPPHEGEHSGGPPGSGKYLRD